MRFYWKMFHAKTNGLYWFSTHLYYDFKMFGSHWSKFSGFWLPLIAVLHIIFHFLNYSTCQMASCAWNLSPAASTVRWEWESLFSCDKYSAAQRDCFWKCTIPVPPVTADANKRKKCQELRVSTGSAFQNLNPKWHKKCQ